MTNWKMTIGIECHVQLATRTKLFSPADNDARDKEPNSVVHPVDYGLPGMLPMLNRSAVELAVKAGKALNAKVANVSRFDRKHYFYPDLPNGYQITQMYNPTILAGEVDVPMEDEPSVKVRIHHAHIEMDAGKLTHYGDYSLVDLNRAGTPLIEIVSEPDMHSPQEAKAYAAELHKLMMYAGVTHGDLYHGNMRFDVNVSVAADDAIELGKRAEVKNLNSFRSVERAAEYEFKRQVELLEKGERIVQETRGWDETTQKTSSQRSKEDAQDYRYMPDADIPPIILSDEEISEIQQEVPLLPPHYRTVWTEAGFNKDIQDALLLSQNSAELVERIRVKSNSSVAKRVGYWFLKVVSKDLQDDEIIQQVSQPISDDYFIELATMVEDGTLNSNAGDTIFFEMQKTSESPKAIAERLNLVQVSDEAVIAQIVDEVIADPANAKAVDDIRSGNEKVIGFLVGQIMKKSQGKANPAMAQKLIKERI
ncbi:MAG: Asp-tRNA(Asn)/Glu-tRNA(Gln) amidotransferase subunit GatB [Candidatus Saccharimonadales bacterium]